MTDPERLVVTSSSSLARVLLRQGLDDAPGPGALPRLAAALGVTLPASALAASTGVAASNALALGATAGTAGTAGTVGVAAGTAVGTGSLAGTLSVAALSKWLLAGIAGGVIVAGAGAGLERLQTAPSARPLVSAVIEPKTAASSIANHPIPVHEPTPTAAVAPLLPSSPALTTPAKPADDDRRARSVDAPGVLPAPAGDSEALGREAAQIDAARRALAAGDFERAARELDAYSATRVVGALDREAAYLRIQLLVRRGELERAREQARRYLLENPHDAHAPRLRELLAEPKP